MFRSELFKIDQEISRLLSIKNDLIKKTQQECNHILSVIKISCAIKMDKSLCYKCDKCLGHYHLRSHEVVWLQIDSEGYWTKI